MSRGRGGDGGGASIWRGGLSCIDEKYSMRMSEEPYISEMNKSGPEDDAIAGTTPLTKF